jgi:hypothetical protein
MALRPRGVLPALPWCPAAANRPLLALGECRASSSCCCCCFCCPVWGGLLPCLHCQRPPCRCSHYTAALKVRRALHVLLHPQRQMLRLRAQSSRPCSSAEHCQAPVLGLAWWHSFLTVFACTGLAHCCCMLAATWQHPAAAGRLLAACADAQGGMGKLHAAAAAAPRALPPPAAPPAAAAARWGLLSPGPAQSLGTQGLQPTTQQG